MGELFLVPCFCSAALGMKSWTGDHIVSLSLSFSLFIKFAKDLGSPIFIFKSSASHACDLLSN